MFSIQWIGLNVILILYISSLNMNDESFDLIYYYDSKSLIELEIILWLELFRIDEFHLWNHHSSNDLTLYYKNIILFVILIVISWIDYSLANYLSRIMIQICIWIYIHRNE